MTVPRIPIAEPVLGEEELANVVEAVRSGWISSLGAFIARFETEFAAFCDARHAVAVANGTAASLASMMAVGRSSTTQTGANPAVAGTPPGPALAVAARRPRGRDRMLPTRCPR